MDATRQPAVTVHLLGGCSLASAAGPLSGRATQRRRLACLALIATAGRHGISRDKLLALLWPEREAEAARHLLADTLWVLRSALGEDALVSVGDQVALDFDLVHCDVDVFETALERGRAADAVAAYTGAFLDGFHLSSAPAFERWIDGERDRLEALFAGALRSLARGAEQRDERAAAVSWWRQAAAHRPYDSEIARSLIEAMARAGDRVGAIRHVQIHSEMLRDLDVDPDPELVEFGQRLRSAADRIVDEAGPATVTAGAPGDAPPPATAPAAGPDADRHAIEAAPEPVSGARSAPRLRIIGLTLAAAIAGATVVLVLVAAVRSILGPQAAPALDPAAMLVAPFNVAADPSLDYLREGIVDLLATSLNGDTGSRAVDPRAAIAAWNATGKGRADLPLARAAAVARGLGAGQLVLGSVVGTPERLTLNVTWYDATDLAVRGRARIQGTADSLAALVDALAGRFLVHEAGVPRHQLADLTTHSLPALRAYLDGRRSYRLGRYGEATAQLEQALRHDSTFALAAIHLWLAAGWGQLTAEPGARERALRLAWAARDRLSAPDRLFLEALSGTRYPEAASRSELFAARVRALNAAPDQPETLALMGAFHVGGVVRGEAGARQSSADYFRRALALDSSYAAVAYNVAREAASARDTATVQRVVQRYLRTDSTSETAQLLHWLAAAVRGEESAILDVRARMPAMHPTALGWIDAHAQLLGVDIDGAAAALTALRAKVRSERELRNLLGREWEHLGNRGRLNEMWSSMDAEVREAPAFGPVEALGVTTAALVEGQRALSLLLTAMFWHRDTTGVRGALAAFDNLHPTRSPGKRADVAHGLLHALDTWYRRTGAPAPDADPFARTVVAETACYAGTGRIMIEDAPAARAALDALRELLARPWTLPNRSAHAACAATLAALIAVAERKPEARILAERADSLLRADPPEVRNQADRMRLMLARAFDALDDPDAALRVIRRHEMNNSPFYLATFLREEGRLAARIGDREGAIRAYTHYLTLRTDPDATLLPEVERVREELAALRAGPRG